MNYELATEAQHKYLAYLCKSKGMTAPQKDRIQQKFIKRFKLWSFSDIDKYQISGVIDYVQKYWTSKKDSEIVKNLFGI